MSGPFSSITPSGQPMWTNLPAPNGNFAQVNVLGLGYQEVGYGEGGYDTPTSSNQAAATPNWTIGSLR